MLWLAKSCIISPKFSTGRMFCHSGSVNRAKVLISFGIENHRIILNAVLVLFKGEAQACVEVDVPGLILEIVLYVAAVIEIVAGCWLNINAEILGNVKL